MSFGTIGRRALAGYRETLGATERRATLADMAESCVIGLRHLYGYMRSLHPELHLTDAECHVVFERLTNGKPGPSPVDIPQVVRYLRGQGKRPLKPHSRPNRRVQRGT